MVEGEDKGEGTAVRRLGWEGSTEWDGMGGGGGGVEEQNEGEGGCAKITRRKAAGGPGTYTIFHSTEERCISVLRWSTQHSTHILCTHTHKQRTHSGQDHTQDHTRARYVVVLDDFDLDSWARSYGRMVFLPPFPFPRLVVVIIFILLLLSSCGKFSTGPYGRGRIGSYLTDCFGAPCTFSRICFFLP